MPKYIVSADVVVPLLLSIEAESEDEACDKVDAMKWRDAIERGYGGDGAEIKIDDCYEDK